MKKIFDLIDNLDYNTTEMIDHNFIINQEALTIYVYLNRLSIVIPFYILAHPLF